MTSPAERPTPTPAARTAVRWLPWRVALANVTLLPLLAVGIGVATLSPTTGLSDLFLMTQDAGVIAVTASTLLALACVRLRTGAPPAWTRGGGRPARP